MVGASGSRSRRTQGAEEGAEACPLPCPDVRFDSDFARRIELFTLRLSAASERREGAGRASLAGGGEEFVAYRPYRPGEDLRALDWNLLARLDRPYVRVTRREASERWWVYLDTSASMGVGPPGKLQRAAEIVCAYACVGARMGARVRIIAASSGAGITVRGRPDLASLRSFLQKQRAAGDVGLARALRSYPPPLEAGRVFVVGDLLDVEPADLLHLARRGRELLALQLLAPIEMTPGLHASGSDDVARAGSRAVEWVDPESGARLNMLLDAACLARYERALEKRLSAWSQHATRHGMSYHCGSTARSFEELALAQLGER